LRQLKQRIALRCALRPFDEVESRAYVVKRLEKAGAPAGAPPVFSSAALQRIHANSRGIPRLINVICENALISGYARQIRTITAEMIDEVAKDLRLDVEAAPLAATASEIAEAKGLIRSLLRLLKTNEIDSSRPLNLGGIEK
jgi:general secretion pathway protein A